ncbi:hypothetical protein D5S18_05085 [Nocardia panacis]|uniref:Uncharacterized protein n=1 Tax=Nocardia panacis TaxID=2340916 RepID=A0A3A4KCY5_9NOCA|nr:hypothetical protein [Nocardia panacis]RJO78293.1 hypothetical protein D5S18_05085 [Nocardia panacis]
MLPTLHGRIQSRILVLGILGALVALVITPLLPTGSLSLGQSYRVTLSVLAATVLVGVLWECLYHFLQQFRWEKDWPTLFGLITIGNEGALMWVLATRTTLVLPAGLRPGLAAFLIQFVTTWLVFWLTVNGPLRVLFHRWRFRGGRFL